MRGLLLALLLLATVLAQVAIAPYFPILGAVVELPTVVLLLLATFAGPYAVTVALPALVLLLGFSTNAPFELLVVALLPILPCAAWIQRQRAIPQTPYALVLTLALAAGLWTRAVFVAEAAIAGADPAIGDLIAQVLLPGAAFDAAAVSIGYALCRRAGWRPRSLDLEQVGV